MSLFEPSRWRTLLLAACLFLGSASAFAQQEQPAVLPSDAAAPTIQPVAQKLPSYFLRLKRDATEVLTAPLDWDGNTWKKIAIGVGAVGVVMLLDEEIRDEIQRHSKLTTDRLARAIEPFGSDYSWGVLAGFYGAGKIFNDPRAEAVAADGLASSLIAAGVITPALKTITGRSRPTQSESAYDFLNRRGSFPSGHTTQAFAVAAVVAEHYDSVWVDVLAYGIAGLVGYARIANNAHFASDVLAGAAIGVAVGKSVVRLNSERQSIRLVPMATPGGGGVSVRIDLTKLFRGGQSGAK